MPVSPIRPETLLNIINLKKGAGKSHTPWLPTGVCIERGKRLLAVDTDTQARLTKSLPPQPLHGPGIEALFDRVGVEHVPSRYRPDSALLGYEELSSFAFRQRIRPPLPPLQG